MSDFGINVGNGNFFYSDNAAIVQSDHDFNLAQSILQRETEVYQYQLNVFNFETMISRIKTLVWPAHLLPYRGMGREQVAANLLDDDDLEVVTELMFRDELRVRLRTEKIELKKTSLMLDVLISQACDIEKIRKLILEIKAK